MTAIEKINRDMKRAQADVQRAGAAMAPMVRDIQKHGEMAALGLLRAYHKRMKEAAGS